MSNVLIAYLIYLPVVLVLTIFVAWSLFKNSRVFMMDIFNGRAEIADATNQLFKIGFYLLNLGFALLILKIYESSQISGQEVVEILSKKVGGFTFWLGLLLFGNLYLFFRGKKKAKANRLKFE